MKKLSSKERAEKMADKLVHEKYYYSSNKAQGTFNKIRIKHLKKICGNIGNRKILDIGIGEGFMAKELKIKNLWGIDLSSKRCKKAKKLLPRAKISVGNAKKLKFKSSFFDGIICADVLEHMNDPEKAIKEMSRVTKKGGFIIVSVPNEPMLTIARIFSLQFPIKNPDHINNIPVSYLTKKFERKPGESYNFPNLMYPFCIWQCYKFVK